MGERITVEVTVEVADFTDLLDAMQDYLDPGIYDAQDLALEAVAVAVRGATPTSLKVHGFTAYRTNGVPDDDGDEVQRPTPEGD